MHEHIPKVEDDFPKTDQFPKTRQFDVGFESKIFARNCRTILRIPKIFTTATTAKLPICFKIYQNQINSQGWQLYPRIV